MTELNAKYIPAMQALNNFYAMLYKALISVVPKKQVSLTGAYVWRGYRIDSYENLARNQYYCQMYPGESQILTFQESYKYKGKYRYPFRYDLNLNDPSFYQLDRKGQLQSLTNFVTTAIRKALDWQVDQDRREVIPTEFLEGKFVYQNLPEEMNDFDKVSDDLILAYSMQNKLFDLLKPQIELATKEVFKREASIHKNYHWRHWYFRGFQMKVKNFSGEKKKGPSDYTWRIYFDEPERLYCERYHPQNFPVIEPFEISEQFLAASEEEQITILYEYAVESFKVH